MESKPIWDQTSRINQIHIIQNDPTLSEFKHHFIIRNVYLPKEVGIEEFASTVHLGFNFPDFTPNSIYIAQIVEQFDQELVDLAIGLRSDQLAIKVAKEVKEFKQLGHTSKVELSGAFKIFIGQLKQEDEKNVRERKSEEKNERERSREKMAKKNVWSRLSENREKSER